MTQTSYLLDQPRRALVLQGIVAACTARGWDLFAAHVRENHVHVVVEAPCPPEKAAHALKAYARRFLNQARLDAPDRKRWARHPSAKFAPTREARERAIHYVAINQGDPMAVYVAVERSS